MEMDHGFEIGGQMDGIHDQGRDPEHQARILEEGEAGQVHSGKLIESLERIISSSMTKSGSSNFKADKLGQAG